MNKSKLVSNLVEKNHFLSKSDVEDSISLILESLSETLAKGGEETAVSEQEEKAETCTLTCEDDDKEVVTAEETAGSILLLGMQIRICGELQNVGSSFWFFWA